MDRLGHHDLTIMFLALGVLLASARLCGEIARRLGQPTVLGEIVAGVLLGPTVLGSLAPGVTASLFPSTGPVALVLDGFSALAVALFLLVAGMEVDLKVILRQSKTAFFVATSGFAVPFALGMAIAWFGPSRLLGAAEGVDPLVFALFFATALSISALPVIAKTLKDLGLFRSDFGMVIITAAIFQDLVGFLIFAVILGMMATPGVGSGLHVGHTIVVTLAFSVVALTLLRWTFHRVLPWLHAYASWPGGVLGAILSIGLLAAAVTEWAGVHAIFGAFLAGVALGDSPRLRERTRATIDGFVSSVFAPIFFASIGLRVDFAAAFDPLLVVGVLALASCGMIAGAGAGARLSGLPPRDALAVGFGMNARGTMEVVLGLLARQAGIIDDRLLVALVVMAIVTSTMSGPLVQRMLRRPTPRGFRQYLSPKAFRQPLAATTAEDTIGELSRAAAPAAGMPPSLVEQAVLQRERQMQTGLGDGVAVPHARLPGLRVPVVAIGLSPTGIDFQAPDGQPARVVILILTPEDDYDVQLEIIADVAKTFSDPALRAEALHVEGFTEFLALLRAGTVRPLDAHRAAR